MREFCALYEQLDRSPATNAPVEALQGLFSRAVIQPTGLALEPVARQNDASALLTGRRLREIALAPSALPEWLFDDCHGKVATVAETIALLAASWRCPKPTDRAPLAEWMGSACRRSQRLSSRPG